MNRRTHRRQPIKSRVFRDSEYNVTGALPRSLHDKAKADLQDIWMAETKKEAEAAFDLFVETYGVKYENAVY